MEALPFAGNEDELNLSETVKFMSGCFISLLYRGTFTRRVLRCVLRCVFKLRFLLVLEFEKRIEVKIEADKASLFNIKSQS